VKAIAAAGNFAFALKTDRSVWAWGINIAGQLGNGTTTNQSLPVQVKDPSGTGFLTDVVAIATASGAGLALLSDATVRAWGLDSAGQLGDNADPDVLTPTLLTFAPPITAPASVCAGSTGNLASVSDAGTGATYVWSISNGSITSGQGSASIAFTAGARGSLELDLSITNGSSCPVSSTTVKVKHLPRCSISGADCVRPNTAGKLYTGPAGMAGYAWTIAGNGVIVGPADGLSVSVTTLGAGSFTLFLSTTNHNGCTNACAARRSGCVRPIPRENSHPTREDRDSRRASKPDQEFASRSGVNG